MPATDRRKPRAEHPDDAHDPAHVDADHAGELAVFADGAHGAADARARQEEVDEHHDHCRDAKREQLVGRRAHAAAERHGDLQRLGEIGGARGEDEFEQAAQSQRRAEARHHHDDDRGLLRTQAPEQDRVEDERQKACQGDGRDGGDWQGPAEG